MNLLTGLSDQPAQTSQLALPDGTLATMTLEYRSNQLGWFMDLSYNAFVLHGQRVVTSPNCLYAYQNLIPFGVMCVTAENAEPTGLEAWVDGSSQLYLLNQQDIIAEAAIFFSANDLVTS